MKLADTLCSSVISLSTLDGGNNPNELIYNMQQIYLHPDHGMPFHQIYTLKPDL